MSNLQGFNITSVTWVSGNATTLWSNGQSFVSPNLTGVQGIQGIQGIQGVAGTNGTNGIDGINGTNGVDGINGTSFSVGNGYLYNNGSNVIFFNDTKNNATMLQVCSIYNDTVAIDLKVSWTDLVNSIGNWSADKSSYTNTTALYSIFTNQTYAELNYLKSVPYQSSAGGWTNTSTQTTTVLVQNLTATGDIVYYSNGCKQVANTTGVYFIC